MEKLFLIDAYALIFKFYYAFISRPMRNAEGLNTSAIYGFTKFIQEILRDEKPKYLGVAFDPKGGNFRHQMFPAYKANRSATPEDIIASVPHIKEILKAMDIPILEVAGYEADDVIGTIAKKASNSGFKVYMVTPDKDYGQLIDDRIFMYKPRKGGYGMEIVGKQQIMEHYKIDDPVKVIDILALWGDTADNVPGVPGIGEKSAIKLVSTLGTVEEILADTSKLKGKQKENVEANIEQLLLAKKLVTIETEVPIEYSPEKLQVCKPDCNRLLELYTHLNFYSFIHDMNAGENHINNAPHKSYTNEPVVSDELNLFSDDTAFEEKKETKESAVEEVNEPLSLFDFVEESEEIKTIKNTNHIYTLIQGNEVDKFIDLLSMQSIFCFDTETSSLDPISCELLGISFCWQAGKAYYLPYSEELGMKLKPILENPAITKIGQNIKYDILVLKSAGVEVGGALWDTMIMHYLINSDERHGMDYLSEKYLNYRPIPISDLIGKGTKQLSMKDIELSRVVEYAAEDADVTYQLYEVLVKELRQLGMEKLYHEVEEPLISVLADMEFVGVKINQERLDVYASKLEEEIRGIETEICSFAEDDAININSPKQLGVLLFEKLKIVAKPKMTKTKQYKTDEEYLSSLTSLHPVVDLILRYRGLNKLLNTYVAALPKLINDKTGRIHSSYNQAVTTTGRLSSTNPNLQNIPIRDEKGREIRASFIAEEGFSILSADYSQVELRIMAHLSGDKSMIEAFNSGLDIHTATAAKIYKVSLDEVTSDMRRNAKSANFGIIYGISTFGLSENLGISRKEAKSLIDGYFDSYPGVKEYMDKSVLIAREKGYAETIYGRRRLLADINSGNRIVVGYAERNAINAPIQGSAADIMKLAMSGMSLEIISRGLASRLIIQVHDEVVIEVSDNEREEVERLVVEQMEGAIKLSVPLTAECGVADNWLDAH